MQDTPFDLNHMLSRLPILHLCCAMFLYQRISWIFIENLASSQQHAPCTTLHADASNIARERSAVSPDCQDTTVTRAAKIFERQLISTDVPRQRTLIYDAITNEFSIPLDIETYAIENARRHNIVSKRKESASRVVVFYDGRRTSRPKGRPR